MPTIYCLNEATHGFNFAFRLETLHLSECDRLSLLVVCLRTRKLNLIGAYKLKPLLAGRPRPGLVLSKLLPIVGDRNFRPRHTHSGLGGL
jgi:hypothetical protein